MPFGNENIGRRKALKTIGAVLAAGAGLAGLSRVNQQLNDEPPKSPQVKPQEQKPGPLPEEKHLPDEREKVRKAKLDALLSVSLKDPKRSALEKEYVQWANTIEDVSLGLKCVVNSNSRIALLEKSYDLRTAENPAHQSLTPEQLAWVDFENIHPETLAMSSEARVIALRILGDIIKQKGIEKFRPDIANRIKKGELDPNFLSGLVNNPELMLLSEGGMARLVVTESGQGLPRPNRSLVAKALDKVRGIGHDWIQYGFAYIGNKPAMEMTNNATNQPKVTNDEAIDTLAKIISEDTGLKFITQNIPGSERDEGSSTGGALGLQIMPNVALRMYKGLKEYFKPGDPLPHPLDPVGATILAYIYIAQGVPIGNDTFQDGYIKPPLYANSKDISDNINFEAIKSWNAHASQINQILTSDRNFIKTFGTND